MKKNKRLLRVQALLLVLATLWTLCLPVMAQSQDAAQADVYIGTAEELEDFAKRCTSDTYSEGLSVVLTADIDASELEISIPVFLGTFDGDGHRIDGLRLHDAASNYGLFSRIERGAVVKNLLLTGEVTPSGTQSRVGALAGENYGRIERCTVSGIVVADSCVGGIAGYNAGSVSGCSVSGVVRGTSCTGGVTGQNVGVVRQCTSGVAVNTTLQESDVSAAELGVLENTLYSLLKREGVPETDVLSDTGGIAGVSSGTITDCVNTGMVGYPHAGYNVGGIAGRQNGQLSGCVNRGLVQGRKDVGGIVGQMTPDVTLLSSADDLDTLQTQLRALQDTIRQAMDEAEDTGSVVTDRLGRIYDYADSARSSAHEMSGQLQTFTEDTISSAQDLLDLTARTADGALPVLEALEESTDAAGQTVDVLRDLIAQLNDGLVYDEQVLAAMQTFSEELDAAGEALERAMKALLAVLPGDDGTEDAQQLRAQCAALQDVLREAQEELAQRGAVTSRTDVRIRNALLAVLQAQTAALDTAEQRMQRGVYRTLRAVDEETLQQLVGALHTAAEELRDAAVHISNAMQALRAAFDALGQNSDTLDALLQQLRGAGDSAQQAADSFSASLSALVRWVRVLSGEEVPEFSVPGTQFSSQSDDLNSALGELGSELSALNAALADSGDSIFADVRTAGDQFSDVMELFFSLLDDTQNADYTSVVEDVSEQSLQSATRGKVSDCDNYGAVNADRNVGGIAGAMAIEYDLDPEDDGVSTQRSVLRSTYQTRAIVLSCNNYGTVQARKSCAGGIAGRMDLGTICESGGWGAVSSESGDYVGGVVGLSCSTVRESYAKCTLSGGKYVGGIAGSGNCVRDCLSMVEITDCTQLCGAVAGEITGEYSGNRFVTDTLAGVDRVSLAGKAEQISYDALCQTEGLPERFRQLTLQFVADGRTLKRLSFAYGDSFDEDVFPDAPEQAGCYVSWDRTSLNDLHFDTVVTAQYVPYVTTLAANVTQDGQARILVEGAFGSGDCVRAQKLDAPQTLSQAVLESWHLEIPDDGQVQHRVRWKITEGERATPVVYVKTADGWQTADSEVIGSYLCFCVPESGEFAVCSGARGGVWLWVAAAGVLVFAVVTVILLRRRTVKRRGAAQGTATK